MIYILDACALIAFFRGEPGKEKVKEILTDFESRVLLHAVNACEIFYDFLRSDDEEMARSVLHDIRMANIEIVEDLSEELWIQAGRHKAKFKRISLADVIALSLAQRFNGTLVTSDHSEFDKVADSGVCKILFIR
ncbi:MAG TPA: type II toxin-antitoxin system VapC family toxin [Candidatus Kapabacteria bacterium]|nr:type II toxin-antitoxin system VapC family toxin [Candidatus Kapabacteria bacterium]